MVAVHKRGAICKDYIMIPLYSIQNLFKSYTVHFALNLFMLVISKSWAMTTETLAWKNLSQTDKFMVNNLLLVS